MPGFRQSQTTNQSLICAADSCAEPARDMCVEHMSAFCAKHYMAHMKKQHGKSASQKPAKS